MNTNLHLLPHPQQPTLWIRLLGSPLRSSGTAKEDRIGFHAFLQHFFRRSNAVLVQRAAAAKVEFALELDALVSFNDVEHGERFGDDFGADVVAWEDEDLAG